ncbi:MAG TPA: YihY/virulence factor BrkB family protein [Nocardioidaceae bacterium]|nr:YihY/virulence factor BrkB family protein [Nocardioidaceae bacterium]
MTDSTASGGESSDTAPDPEDPRKPDTPPKLSGRSWRYGLKRAVGEFSKDNCTDLAAALTYFAVLSLFPALLALVSLVSLFGQGQQTTDTLLSLMETFAPASAVDTLREPITSLSSASGAGITLVIGLVGALWSASGYVGAFGRAMNRVYEVDEGRPVWKLKPAMILVTLVLIALAAVALVALILSGPLAERVGGLIGLGSTAVLVWQIAKWPVLLFVVVLIVALLYHSTPNVKQPKFRWMSIGAFIAIITWIIASAAFAFYVATFGSYGATYGAVAGVIVLLLWLWITNLALLFGAEVDAEVERGRELQGGIEAERNIQLPPRDTKASDKAAEKEAEQEAKGREIRTDRH